MCLEPTLITNIWSGAGDLIFPRPMAKSWEVLGPLKVGADIASLVFSLFVTDIEILAPYRLAIAADPDTARSGFAARICK